MRRNLIFLSLFIFVILGFSFHISAESFADEAEPPGRPLVYVIPIKDWEAEKMIDLAISGFLRRKFAEARENKARLVVLELDTAGGRVDAALKIADLIKEYSDLNIVAFVNDSATSAGALVALACPRIFFADASTMGSATVVIATGGGAEKAAEKYQSFMRSTFRSLAEKNGYPQRLAEAMVDEDIEVKKVSFKGKILYVTAEDIRKLDAEAARDNVAYPEELLVVCPAGKLLNMSGSEAVEYGFGKRATTVQDICAELGIVNPEFLQTEITWVENMARVLSGPALSGLLLTVGMLAIYFALAQPGFAIPEAIAILCFTLFFWGRFLVGMAGPIEISMFLVGIMLLAVELFLIPGFGVTGGLGVFLIILSIFFSYIPFFDVPDFETKPWQWEYVQQGILSVLLMVVVGGVGFLWIMKHFGDLPLMKRLVLSAGPAGGLTASGAESHSADLVGKEGVAISDLRPAGKVEVGDELLDVVAEGAYIAKDKKVRVTQIEGNRIVVEEVADGDTEKET